MKNIKFIINKSEIAAGTRGSSLGPDAIQVESWKNEDDIFRRFPIEEIKNVNYLLNYPNEHKFAKRIDGLISVYENISNSVKNNLLSDNFPIILAGDHASAGGTIAGIKSAFPNKKLGVVWIDAHGDIHTPYTTPSGNMHGMPLTTALYLDNIEEKKNIITNETKLLWEKLKNIAYQGPKIEPENLIFVGVRDLEQEEIKLIERLNIKNFTVEEIKQIGAEQTAININKKLSNCDLIYISFDVDSMDTDETSLGTGTPVKNGLSIKDAEKIISILIKNPKLVCFEIVEINPCLDDKQNKMAEIAYKVIKNIIIKTIN
jgi:arginase